MIETYNRLDTDRPFSPSKGNQTKYHVGDKWLALYGRQLMLNPVNLDQAFDVIREHYGILISNRMKAVYQLQSAKYQEFYQEPNYDKDDIDLERA